MDEPDQKLRLRYGPLNWLVYENLVCNPIEERWMVFLVRDEQRILARALTPEQSWALAAGMVEEIDEQGR